jgi:hypothetical protein
MGKKKKKLCYSVVTHILGAHTHTCTHTVFAGTSNLSTLTLDLVIYICIIYPHAYIFIGTSNSSSLTRQGHHRVSDAGGSRRSYRSGRASVVAEGNPFPEGAPKWSVGGFPGWHVIQRMCWPPPGVTSVSLVVSSGPMRERERVRGRRVLIFLL